MAMAIATITAMGKTEVWNMSLHHPPSTMETWKKSSWTPSMNQDRAAQEVVPTVTGKEMFAVLCAVVWCFHL